jgi:hypothetical protein
VKEVTGMARWIREPGAAAVGVTMAVTVTAGPMSRGEWTLVARGLLVLVAMVVFVLLPAVSRRVRRMMAVVARALQVALVVSAVVGVVWLMANYDDGQCLLVVSVIFQVTMALSLTLVLGDEVERRIGR